MAQARRPMVQTTQWVTVTEPIPGPTVTLGRTETETEFETVTEHVPVTTTEYVTVARRLTRRRPVQHGVNGFE